MFNDNEGSIFRGEAKLNRPEKGVRNRWFLDRDAAVIRRKIADERSRSIVARNYGLEYNVAGTSSFPKREFSVAT